tara:strand:- start:29 stop:304 length:276 start_codon:yes stop_codon:yes gene_type:complete
MILKAILEINPNAQVSISDGVIEWLNGTTPIPQDQIDAKVTELKEKNNYVEQRIKEYPTHEDCIHALLDGGDTLTELQEKRQAVKNKYPKP